MEAIVTISIFNFYKEKYHSTYFPRNTYNKRYIIYKEKLKNKVMYNGAFKGHVGKV